MAEEERKQIAVVISSILISTTRRMTIIQLDNDFMNTEGYRIPFRKFGCSNLEQFLRTLNDKVQIRGYGANAEVQVVISDKTAHINDLICRQRNSTQKRSRNRYNRSFNRIPNRRSSLYYSNNVANCTRIPSPIVPDDGEASSNLDYMSAGCSSPIEQNKSFETAEPKQMINRDQIIDEIYFSDEENRKNTRVPALIQNNLRKLISNNLDGIMCSSLLDIYKKQYGTILNYSEYGYRSIAEMCTDLKNIFNVIQLDKSDIKLFNKNSPIPEDTLNVVKKFQMMKIKASRETATKENALPTNEVEDIMCQIYSEKRPPDVFPFGEELEKQWIDPGTGELDYIDVSVGEIYDPSKFWINIKNYANKLNALMDELQVFYGAHGQEYRVPFCVIQSDMYIACIFSGEYHRARIVDASQKVENIIKVYFVDYGTVSIISIEKVCYLHNKFAEFPEQALRARLAGIYPPEEDAQWSRAAARCFLDLVLQKDLVAQIVKIDEKRKILDLVLADTSIENVEIFINDALVLVEHALFTFQVNSDSDVSTFGSENDYSTCTVGRSNSPTRISNPPKKTRLTQKEVLQIFKKQTKGSNTNFD